MDRLRAAPYVPDVIFLDIQMRHYSGYDLLRMLKEDPVYKDAKVIAMTANRNRPKNDQRDRVNRRLATENVICFRLYPSQLTIPRKKVLRSRISSHASITLRSKSLKSEDP